MEDYFILIPFCTLTYQLKPDVSWFWLHP